MMALLKQQPMQSPTAHRTQPSAVPFQPPITLTLLDNDLVAVSKQQQGPQYLGSTTQHQRMFIPGFHIPISGEYCIQPQLHSLLSVCVPS